MSGKPAVADPSRLTQLRDWLPRNGLDIPIAVLLRGSELATTRAKMIGDDEEDTTDLEGHALQGFGFGLAFTPMTVLALRGR